MDSWSLERYQRPWLNADIELLPNESAIKLTCGGDRRLIAFDDAAAALDVGALLTSLRDPASPVWDQIRRPSEGMGWSHLLERLDEWSFIQDANGKDTGLEVERQRTLLREIRDAALAYVRSGVSGPAQSAVSEHAAALLDGATNPAARPERGWTDPNFYLGVAGLALFRLRGSSPPAFETAGDFLAKLCARDGLQDGRGSTFESVGFYSIEAIKAHLNLLADCLVRSVGKDAARLTRPLRARAEPIDGSTMVRDVERAFRAHSAQCGPGRFFKALEGITTRDHPLALGCHVEEYHVTRRFVEMITPLLHMDMTEPVRRLAYRYFAEEVGHEAFERDTCVSLGVDPAKLVSACPLPLHVAFVDVFTQLSTVDPVAFLAAVPITEGMFGEMSPVNARLDQLATELDRSIHHRHEELNIALNHSSIARLALQHIAAVDTSAQQGALDKLALMFELNHRAWDLLTSYYGGQSKLELPVAFDPALLPGDSFEIGA